MTVGASPLPPLGRASARLAGKPGPAPSPRNARGQFARADGTDGAPKRGRHGMAAVKAKILLRGLGAVDRRTVAARDALDWRRDLLMDLGGADRISAAQAALVELAVRSRLYLDHLDAHLLERSTLLTRKTRRVIALLEDRRRMADSLVKTLVALGLERRAAPPMTLAEELSQRRAKEPGCPE